MFYIVDRSRMKYRFPVLRYGLSVPTIKASFIDERIFENSQCKSIVIPLKRIIFAYQNLKIMVKEVCIEGVKQTAIIGDWFQGSEGIVKLRNALKDELEQCSTNQEKKNNVQADSIFYVLRLIEDLNFNDE